MFSNSLLNELIITCNSVIVKISYIGKIVSHIIYGGKNKSTFPPQIPPRHQKNLRQNWEYCHFHEITQSLAVT